MTDVMGQLEGDVLRASHFRGEAFIKALFHRHSTVMGLATRGIMMIESCRVIGPTEK
jgi:hypothetical protein